jgi:RHS repeat-associated protein
MANVYEGHLSGSNKGFDYNGKTYKGGDAFGPFTPCETLGFLNASRAANPDSGYTEEQSKVVEQIQSECPATKNEGAPQPDSGSPPVDANPATTGGDSGANQGAPAPKTSATVGVQQPTDEGTDNSAPTDEKKKPDKGEPNPNHGGELPQKQTNAGDPVNLFNGSFYLQETDLTIPNTLIPLSFTRFYQSGAASYGPFGWNWDHNFNLYVRELNSGDIALWRNLHEDTFKFDGVKFEPPRGVFEKLERVIATPQTYEIIDKGGLVMHFERPLIWFDADRIPLLWIQDKYGNFLQFTYGSEDKLAEVRDDDDRFFSFVYDTCGLLVEVSDHTGRKFQYAHDEQTMQLTNVKSPGISDYPDGLSRIYHYEQPWALPQLRHNIIRVEDAEGNVYLENTFEEDPSSWSFARVKEQYYGGYLYQFQYTQLQWVPENSIYINIPAVRVEVMNPDFGLETYTFNYRGDLLDRRYRLNKDKSFRVVVWQYEFDEQGNPTKTTSPDGSEDLNVYDFANDDPLMRNNLLQKEITSASGFPSPSRIIWQGKYEPNFHQLIEEKNEAGAVTKYRYDFDIAPADPANSGKLIEIIEPEATLPDASIQKSKTTFEYNIRGQIKAINHPDGTRNEFSYGLAGEEKDRLVEQVFDAGGLNITHQIKYDLFGFNAENIDGNGFSSKQIFNALGLPEKVIFPAIGGIVSENILHYNSDKKLILSERPKGSLNDPLVTGSQITDKFERDVLGFPTKYILSSNTSEARVFNVSNDFRGQPIEIINPDGSKIRKIFDERGLPVYDEIRGTDGKKISSKKVYDRTGRLIQETTPFGLTTHYKYDGFSRISKIILPNGTEIRKTWLKNDLPETEEIIGDDGNGAMRQLTFKSFSYDEKKRKISETVKTFSDNPGVSTNLTTTFYYDQSDRIVKTINNRGGVSTRQYDGMGRLLIEIDPNGNKQQNTYDKNGNVIQIDSYHKEPDGSVSHIFKKFKFDKRNRKIESIEPDGAKNIYEYDDRNLIIKMTDSLGNEKQTFFDSFHNKVREIYDPAGLNILHQWELDSMSRVKAYIDPTGQVSSYLFDTVGRNYKIQYPNGFSSTKTFNGFNQIVKEQLGSGVEFDYKFDVAGRVFQIINSAFPVPLVKIEDHEFKYDGLDRVVSAKAGTSLISRKYDSQSRLLSELTLGNTLSCSYNDATGEVEKVWPDGRTEKLHHDVSGILTKIEETINGTLGSGNNLIANFKPSGPEALGEASYQAGINIKHLYDERKRLTEIIAQSPAGINENLKYRYNTANTKQVEALIGKNSKTSYFEFDSNFRLTDAKDSFPAVVSPATTQTEHDNAINLIKIAAATATHEEIFKYDQSNARTKYSETGSPDKNYLFAPGHKIQSDGTNTFAYHAEGTIKSDGQFTYEADAFGRIIKIKSVSTVVTEIAYDAFGRPSVVKEAGKPDKSFNYFGTFVVQENEAGVATKQITINPETGVPIANHSLLGTYYTLFDSRYNLIGLVDTSGHLLETYRYKSFGKPKIFDSTNNEILSSVFGITPIFGGQYYLSSTGLYLSKRRLMNPVNGVFLSADPRGYIDSSNLYTYALQNPLDLIDPDGEFAFFAILAVAAIGAAVAGALNATRQGIAIAEGSQEGWEWGQFGMSVGIGAVAAPLLVVAPELAVPLAAIGVAGGVNQISEGHYATGAFDIVTSLAPFAFKGPRNATFGAGTKFGQMRGLGEAATFKARTGRFQVIQDNMSNYRPTFSNRKIGVGFAPMRGGGPEGHVSVVFDDGKGGFTFLEKNAVRLENGDLAANFNAESSLPEFYFPERYGTGRPFSYEWIEIPKSNWIRGLDYGNGRINAGQYTEPFSFDGKNCSNFVADVLGQSKINGVSDGSSAGALGRNFNAFSKSFPNLIASGYGAPFYGNGIHPNIFTESK